MLAFSEIIKSNMPKKLTSKNFKLKIAEKLLEILLIILSVYIALFVEGWAERRKEHKQLIQYYTNFNSEISEDAKELQDVIGDSEKHIKQTNNFLQLIKSKVNSDSLTWYLSKIMSSTLFSTSKMLSYKSMVASGDLRLIEDISVRHELIELELSYEGVKIQENFYIDFITKKLPDYIDKHIDMTSNKPLEASFFQAVDFKNMVVLFRLLNESRLEQYKTALETAWKTQNVVKEELKAEL